MTKKRNPPEHTDSKNVNDAMNELISDNHGIERSETKKRRIGFTEEIGAEICVRLASGESLRRICKDEHLPHKTSIHRWILFCEDENVHKDVDLREKLCSFRDHYNNARIIQAEGMLDEMTDICDDGTNDYMEKEVRNGDTITVPNHDHINRSRLRVDTRKWLTEVCLPKIQNMKKNSVDIKNKGTIQLIFDKQDEEA